MPEDTTLPPVEPSSSASAQPSAAPEPAAESPTSGGVTIAGGDVAVAGDVVGRDKIVNNIQNIYQRALTAAEEARTTETLEQQRLAQGVSELAQRLQGRAEDTTQTLGNPYKGLLIYRLGDAGLFFGRSRAIRELSERMRGGPLTILHSESGAGKSSLIQAGIMPRLLADGHLPVYVRPYSVEPHLALKRAFIGDLGSTPMLATASLREFLTQVSRVLNPAAEATRLYIFLDQFEELFTQQPEPAQQEFVKELADCLDDASLNVRWVLAMRTEFFGALASFRPRIPDPFANDYLLNRMTRDEAGEAIREPVRRRFVAYQDGLVDAILDELSQKHKDIAPPEIQIVCSALFEELGREQKTITRALYDQLGGAAGLLQGHVERVITRDIPRELQPAARRILEALISLDGRRIIRAPSVLEQDVAQFKLPPDRLAGLLTQMVDSRLLRRHEATANHPEPGYELAHDYLVNKITLDPAIQARRQAQDLLDQEVRSFERFGNLLSEDELDLLAPRQHELTVTPKAHELIQKSLRVRQRRRGLLAGSLVLVIILMVLGVASAITALSAQGQLASAEATRVAVETQSQSALLQQAESETRAQAAAATQAAAQIQQATSEAAAASAASQALQAQIAATAAQGNAEAARQVVRGLFLKNGLIPVGTGPDALTFDGTRLWVANEGDSTLNAINPETGELLNTVSVGRSPRAVLFDGMQVWVANAGNNTLQAIQPETGAVGSPIAVGQGPQALIFDGARLWVANGDDNTVQVVDPVAGSVTATIRVGNKPRALAWDGRRIWVANMADSTLQSIDPQTQQVSSPIGVEAGPAALLYSPSTGVLWIANQGANKVQLFDPGAGAFVNTIVVGLRPVGMALADDGRVWLAAQGANAVQAVDAQSGQAGALIQTGNLPRALAFAGQSLWVANLGDNTVQAIDPVVGSLSAPIQVDERAGVSVIMADSQRQALWIGTRNDGAVRSLSLATQRLSPRNLLQGQPTAMALEGSRLWVALAEGFVRAINFANNTIVSPIRVGGSPSALAHDGVQIWVANTASNTIQSVNMTTRIPGPPIPVGNRPAALVYDGLRLWVANAGDDTVQAIAPTSGQVGPAIAVGNAPVALLAQNGRLWVANRDSNTVQVIDTTSGQIMTTLPVGNSPSALAFDGTRVWVANTADNTVQFISAETFVIGKIIQVEAGPFALTFDGQVLWVASGDTNTLQSITIPR